MSYRRHLEFCNRFDPARFLPLLLGERRVGFVRRDNARCLAAFPRVFELSADAITLLDTGGGVEATTYSLGEVTDGLIRAGVVKRRRNERFAITQGWGGPLLFELDRGAIEFFGARAYAVHLNGWRPGTGGPEFWIAKRSATKPSAPGKLDNMVAGGLGAGYTAWQTMVKEAGEEAGVPEALAGRAHSTGSIRYRIELPGGMRDESMFLYDLELPADFVPRSVDGEVEDFRILSVRECLRRVRETEEFKYDVNLVLIDFGLRHGLITPEQPGYLELIDGLRGGLIRGAI